MPPLHRTNKGDQSHVYLEVARSTRRRIGSSRAHHGHKVKWERGKKAGVAQHRKVTPNTPDSGTDTNQEGGY